MYENPSVKEVTPSAATDHGPSGSAAYNTVNSDPSGALQIISNPSCEADTESIEKAVIAEQAHCTLSVNALVSLGNVFLTAR